MLARRYSSLMRSKRAQRLRFGVEDLHGLRAGKVFLQKSVDARDARAHQVVTLARAACETRSSRANNIGTVSRLTSVSRTSIHSIIADDRDDHHQVAEQIRDACGEQLVERIDVAGQPRHDAADGIAIVVSNFLMLEFVVKLFAHVEHHVLADTVEEDRLEVREDKPQHLRAEDTSRPATSGRQSCAAGCYQSIAYW